MFRSNRTIPERKIHEGKIQAGKIHDRSSRIRTGLALLICCGVSGIAAAATLCVNPGGTSGCKSTIGAAVAAASPGDTIQVAHGTYKEQVNITKSLAMVGNNWPTIDATGLSNGIFINGMWAAPGTGVVNVVISGFTVRNAKFEGILIANGYNIALVGNHVLDNDKALDIENHACPGIPPFETNEGDDCGEGIHLMGAVNASVVRNESEGNSGGILISDETGPSRDNLISGNRVHDNPFDCGITMASHGPATSVIPSAKVSYGVYRNTIAHNISRHNGFQVPGAGAGVGIFAPFPGTTAAGNVVIDNDLRDNGATGVAMHNHAAAPAPAPPINLNDNVIVGNRFSGNGPDGGDAATSGPTGINIYSIAQVNGTVISQNAFDDEAIDIGFKAPGQVNALFNDFDTTGIGVENSGAGVVNARQNWWNCAAGPGKGGCATVAGSLSRVWVVPWLTAPFNADSN